MSDGGDTRLLRDYITGQLDEDQAADFEERLLSDDAFADSLDLGETELLQAWVDGDLAPELAEQVANLVATSPRLRARADTAFGLVHQSRDVSGVTAPRPRSSPWLVVGVVTIAVLMLVAAALVVRGNADRAALEERLGQLETELEEARAAEMELRRQLARARAEERAPDAPR